jgi:transposase
MRAYSLDLRQKVVAAVERGGSTIEEVTATFGVGLTFVKKTLRQHRETGDLSPRPHGGGHAPRLSAKHLELLRSEVARRPGKTIPALRDHLEGHAAPQRQHADRQQGALAPLLAVMTLTGAVDTLAFDA